MFFYYRTLTSIPCMFSWFFRFVNRAMTMEVSAFDMLMLLFFLLGSCSVFADPSDLSPVPAPSQPARGAPGNGGFSQGYASAPSSLPSMIRRLPKVDESLSQKNLSTSLSQNKSSPASSTSPSVDASATKASGNGGLLSQGYASTPSSLPSMIRRLPKGDENLSQTDLSAFLTQENSSPTSPSPPFVGEASSDGGLSSQGYTSSPSSLPSVNETKVDENLSQQSPSASPPIHPDVASGNEIKANQNLSRESSLPPSPSSDQVGIAPALEIDGSPSSSRKYPSLPPTVSYVSLAPTQQNPSLPPAPSVIDLETENRKHPSLVSPSNQETLSPPIAPHARAAAPPTAPQPMPQQHNSTQKAPPMVNVDVDADPSAMTHHPSVMPFNYKAEDEILEFEEEEEGVSWDGMKHRVVTGLLVALCVVGLGGFVYKVKTNKKRPQYQPLSKRSVSI